MGKKLRRLKSHIRKQGTIYNIVNVLELMYKDIFTEYDLNY